MLENYPIIWYTNEMVPEMVIEMVVLGFLIDSFRFGILGDCCL